jgi:hypothetical protein
MAALGLLSAFAGLPWWLSAAAGITAVFEGIRSFMLTEIPKSPLEFGAFTLLFVILALATREVGDLLSKESGPYRYFATDVIASAILLHGPRPRSQTISAQAKNWQWYVEPWD